MFGVQLYKNNARALLLRIMSILNLDWLQHESSVRGVYEYIVLVKGTKELYRLKFLPFWKNQNQFELLHLLHDSMREGDEATY